MSFDEKFISDLKSKLNIVDVVSQYCSLSKKGGSYWACCPLPGHSERTPSFSVNEAGQFYKCFGCSRGGDVIKFIMEMESLEFYEAVKLLAERAHMQLPDDGKESSEKTNKNYADKETLKKLLRDTALYYVNCLKQSAAEKHREYIKKRRLTNRDATFFGLGASLSFEGLPQYLLKKGYNYQQMTEAGVVQYNSGKDNYFDAEAKRLIFPIIDGYGTVVAFGGRELENSGFAKYKNTGETRLFNKRKTLYNINNLKKLKHETGTLPYVIMVEGYMDTITIYNAGFRNVVASMGTSLTIEQARLLKRYTDTVLICYDGDSAGQKATVRGLEILNENGLTVRVVSLPDGLDPDELINQRGASAYKKCLDDALPLIDFKLKLAKIDCDVDTLGGKRKYIDESLRIINQCKNAALQEELLKKLRDESGITYDSLKRELERNADSAETAETNIPEALKNDRRDQDDNSSDNVVEAERFLLCSCIFDRAYASQFRPELYKYSTNFHTEAAQYVAANKALNKKTDVVKLSEFSGEDNLGELEKILDAENVVDSSAREKFFSDCAALMEKRRLSERLNELNKQFSEENDVEKRKVIAVEIMNTANKIASLRK